MDVLIVVDMQKDFVSGALGTREAVEIVPYVVGRVVDGVNRGETILFTRDTHEVCYPETQEGRNLPVKHCVKGSHGWQIYGQTAAALEEVEAKAIDKLVFGMDVTDPAIAAVLPEQAGEIELVGLVSNICVVSNACVLQSRYPEATIQVDAACTDSFDKALHEKVLDVLEGLQVRVINR